MVRMVPKNFASLWDSMYKVNPTTTALIAVHNGDPA